MNKVTVIGAGSVGSTIAYTLAVGGTASEILLIDINEKKAEGEAMDIRQGAPFCNPVNLYDGKYEDAAGSDIVIITSGVPRKPGQSRLELAQTNVNILKDIASKITKFAPNAIYIIVSNPVDVMTYVFHKISGIPEGQIIGSGTILDTARLRSCIAEKYELNQRNVHAYVFGEHGDSSFIPWSVANISNVPADEYIDKLTIKSPNDTPLNHEEIENYVRRSGGRIIESKGATFYAVAIAVCHICKTIFGGMDTTLSVSTMMHGEYGIDDVCISTLSIVGEKGVMSKLLLDLTEEEVAKLHHSADCLKEVIKSIEY